MAHERQGDTVEELESIERMLVKRIEDLDARRDMLVVELQKVIDKRKALQEGR
jgi:hypothetical protein